MTPATLVEIADGESAEARDALRQDRAAAEMMAPMLELMAAPLPATLVSRPAQPRRTPQRDGGVADAASPDT